MERDFVSPTIGILRIVSSEVDLSRNFKKLGKSRYELNETVPVLERIED